MSAKQSGQQANNTPAPKSVLQDSRLITGAALFEGPLRERKDIIDGFIPEEAIVALVGGAGIGKSTLSRQITWSGTTGTPFLGRAVNSTGPVLVISAEEGREAIRRGLDRVAREESGDLERVKQNLYVVSRETPLMISHDDDCAFIEQIAREVKPRLIIFDSVATLMGVDLSNAQEVVRITKWLMRLVASLDGGSIILISHTRKKGRGGPVIEDLFGSFQLGAALDCAYHLTRIGTGDNVKWSCTKMREGAHPEEMHLGPITNRGGHVFGVVGDQSKGPDVDDSIERTLTATSGLTFKKLVAAVRQDSRASKRLIESRINALVGTKIRNDGTDKAFRLIWVG